MSFSYLIIAVLLCSVPAMFVLTAVILVYVLVHVYTASFKRFLAQ